MKLSRRTFTKLAPALPAGIASSVQSVGKKLIDYSVDSFGLRAYYSDKTYTLTEPGRGVHYGTWVLGGPSGKQYLHNIKGFISHHPSVSSWVFKPR